MTDLLVLQFPADFLTRFQAELARIHDERRGMSASGTPLDLDHLISLLPPEIGRYVREAARFFDEIVRRGYLRIEGETVRPVSLPEGVNDGEHEFVLPGMMSDAMCNILKIALAIGAIVVIVVTVITIILFAAAYITWPVGIKLLIPAIIMLAITIGAWIYFLGLAAVHRTFCTLGAPYRLRWQGFGQPPALIPA